MVAGIMELGYPRDDVLRALEASRGNADLAVEFLMMGQIPAFARGGAGTATQPQAAGGDFDAGDDSEDEGGNPFDLIKNTPQFQQLRLLAQQSPQLLEQVLHQLPPELINVINQNQEEFIRVLNEPIVAPAGGLGALGGLGQGAPVPAGQAAPPGQAAARRGGPAPGTVQIRVSPEDEAIINNLVAMTGCTKDQVIRAYALFDKDAEVTANYLFDHGHDDDGPGFGGGFGGGGFGGDFGGFGGQ
jgi:UV excision repair protein RAD23